MYRFAAFDPFERSKYFGRSFDLGQFERFRRVFHTPAYKTLINHDSATVVGRFVMGEGRAALRVLAKHDRPLEEQTYTITMIQVGFGLVWGACGGVLGGGGVGVRLWLDTHLPPHPHPPSPPSIPPTETRRSV